MTQEKLDALQRILDKWHHMIDHALAVAILAIVAVIILTGIAKILDGYFEIDPICQCALFLAAMIALGVWLL